MTKDKSQPGIVLKRAAHSSDAAPEVSTKSGLIDKIPNYKEYKVTPFKAEALSSF